MGMSGFSTRLPVSIHAPTRGATSERSRSMPCTWFQSTHPRGVRPPCPSWCATSPTSFNPRTHEGCDADARPQGRGHEVSIHAPTRGATSILTRPWCRRRGFNPRTHEGCDGHRLGQARGGVPVSIHAPTRGATVHHQREGDGLGVSIHAPTRGATLPASRSPCTPRSFNPRTHEGCDLYNSKGIRLWQRFQSTHPRGVRLVGVLLSI